MKKNISKLLFAIFFIASSITFISCAGNEPSKKNILPKSGVDTTVSMTPQENSKFNFNSKETSIDSEYLISQLNAKGYEPKVVTATSKIYDKLFFPPQQDVLINRGELSIYQYNINQKLQMTSDYNSMYNYSYLFSQNEGNWIANFHLFKAGRIFVVYDGSDVNIVKTLNEILNTSIK